MDDPITRMTMVATIARWNVASNERRRQDDIRKAAAAKVEECGAVVEQCIATCKALGFDRDNKKQWDEALRRFGAGAAELYNSSRDPSLPVWNFKPPAPPPLTLTATDLLDLDIDLPGDEPKEEEAAAKPERPTIKDIVLERLRVAGEIGRKAADIRDFIEKTYGGDIHEKTVGMTLYRLLKDGKVHRDKHTWFIAPEAMNPGAPTPGSDSSPNSRKED